MFGLQASADGIRYGTQAHVDDWARFDFAPVLSRPLQLSFLDVTPSVGYRFTRYGKTLATETIELPDGGTTERATVSGPALNRTFFETNLEVRGPTFARVYDTPGSPYSDRFKHTIGPEVTWQYRTRVEDANSIPKFERRGLPLRHNSVMYALVQRFYAKRPGPTGKAVPYSFFEWRLGQTYYVQISDGQNAAAAYDPNYSSSAYGPGNQPEHLSPLQSRMRLRPTPDYAIDYNVEYDVNFQQLRRMTRRRQRDRAAGEPARQLVALAAPLRGPGEARGQQPHAARRDAARRLAAAAGARGLAGLRLHVRHPVPGARAAEVRGPVLRLLLRLHPLQLERHDRQDLELQLRAGRR